MCSIVYLMDGDKFIQSASTKGELRTMTGVEPLAYSPDDGWTDEFCLCPCNIEATAVLAGMSCQPDGSGDYEIRTTHPKD